MFTTSRVSRQARARRPLCAGLVVALGCGASADPFRDASEPLPVEEAFVFTSWLQGEHLVAHWDMPEGYYLYRHGFAVTAGEGATLGTPAIPPGEAKVDDHFGESQVHYGNVEITVPVIDPTAVVTARIRYQGCADSGLCYPAQTRTVTHAVTAVTHAVTKSAASITGEDGTPAALEPASEPAKSARPPVLAEDAAEE